MVQTIVNSDQHKKLHPHKFTLWIAIASILMMFAGLTSAFIIKSNFTGWRTIVLPKIFWVSTAVILLSSLAIHFATKNFKQREMQKYRMLLGVTLLLGIIFIICQFIGFSELWAQNIRFKGSSGAGQFFYAITSLHALHILGGIVALAIMFIKSFIGKTKLYSAIPVEVMSLYWHFIDVLWIYLMIFFLIVG